MLLSEERIHAFDPFAGVCAAEARRGERKGCHTDKVRRIDIESLQRLNFTDDASGGRLVDYSTLSAEELALICFRTGDELAWAEFIRRFQPLIAGVVLRVARQWGEASPQVVDDLVQETYLKLCAERLRMFRDFSPTHENSIYGFIKVFAANLSQDYFRASRSLKRGGGAFTASGDCERAAEQPVADSTERSAERMVLIREIDTCLREITSGLNTERDRRIFWLYYRAGMTASAIAGLTTIGLSVKGVESTLARLTRLVRATLHTGSQKEASSKALQKGFPPAESL